MAIEANVLNTISDQLKNAEGNKAIYDRLEEILNKGLNKAAIKNGIPASQLNFFLAGDHILGTNLGNESAVVAFVSLKSNKRAVEAVLKVEKFKKSKKLLSPELSNTITDKALTRMLFNEIVNYFDANTKLYVKNNIILINLNGEVKIRIVIGYNFDGSFEYNYLGAYYKEDFLKFINELDKKELETGNYINMVKVIKSIEIELIRLNIVNSKIYDKLNFVEHMVYNVPNELLTAASFSEAFVKTLNYLKNVDILTFKLAGTNEVMFNKIKTDNDSYNIYDANSLIKSVEYFYNNFSKLY